MVLWQSEYWLDSEEETLPVEEIKAAKTRKRKCKGKSSYGQPQKEVCSTVSKSCSLWLWCRIILIQNLYPHAILTTMFNFVFSTLVSTPQYQKMSDEPWPSWMGLLVVLLLSIMAIAFARCYSPNRGAAMLDGPTANMSMGAMATHGMSVNISMGVMIGINDLADGTPHCPSLG